MVFNSVLLCAQKSQGLTAANSNESAILSGRRVNWEFRLLSKQKKINLAKRFRGLLPVVVDVETSGLDASSNALLELAAVSLDIDSTGKILPQETFSYFIEPFPGAVLNTEALAITGIDPFQPLRYAIPERQALERLFAHIRAQLATSGCIRAVLVGHNAWFDLAFILAAAKRSGINDAPIHSFTTFDTATLAAVALGETVLARSVREAGFEFDVSKAHSAVYDAKRTAELFCFIVNNFGLTTSKPAAW